VLKASFGGHVLFSGDDNKLFSDALSLAPSPSLIYLTQRAAARTQRNRIILLMQVSKQFQGVLLSHPLSPSEIKAGGTSRSLELPNLNLLEC